MIILNSEDKRSFLDLLGQLENNPDKFISKRIVSINKTLTKIHDHPVKSGNISMFQHLTNLKKKMIYNPGQFVQEEIARVRRALNGN